jgi:23S rRNA (uracil1939-C5)-methyltransferase
MKNDDNVTLTIQNLAHDGRGVARSNGKTVFVSNALPGETVEAKVGRIHRSFDEAKGSSILSGKSDLRVVPTCEYFGKCGGCDLQHIRHSYQLEYKQIVLAEILIRHSDLTAEKELAAVARRPWGYRRNTRISISSSPAYGLKLGFREKGSSSVVNCLTCDVLKSSLSDLLPHLATLIQGLDLKSCISEAELLSTGDDVTVVLFCESNFSASDLVKLGDFSSVHKVSVCRKKGKIIEVLGSVVAAHGYHIKGLYFQVSAGSFLQTNHEINKSLVEHVLQVLSPSKKETIADLFCGIGNFTLPVAQMAGSVVGIECDKELLAEASANAALNVILNCEFLRADLFNCNQSLLERLAGCEKILLDPPRFGALNFVSNCDFQKVGCIVYVSCNPSTFARDAKVLCGRHKFTLTSTRIFDMFPQTAHVELVGVFQKET